MTENNKSIIYFKKIKRKLDKYIKDKIGIKYKKRPWFSIAQHDIGVY